MLSYLQCLFSLLAVTSCVDIEFNMEFNNTGQHYFSNEIINGNTVDLKVYYESFCPCCVEFHTGELNDTYSKIGSYIDLKTYPYGHANRTEENGKIKFTCQHGPVECYGNKLHACAKDILKNVSRWVIYNSCMMQYHSGGSTDKGAKTCGKLLNIDSKPIIECAKSEKGDQLLNYYGEETDQLTNMEYVPWILLNGEFFYWGSGDLMKKICKALPNPPPACKK